MLKLNNINKTYKIREDKLQYVLNDLSVTLPETGFVTILGSSGNGKTTLLNIIGGLDEKDSGIIKYNDQEVIDYVSFRREEIGFVFQDYNLIEHLNIVDNVVLSISDEVENKEENAISILTELGLKDHLHKKPNQLSGGQMQRVSIARMIAKDVRIIICDEPTGNLDEQTEEVIASIIKELSKERLVLMVTHNRNLANKYSDRILEIEEGKIYKDSGTYKSVPHMTKHEKISFDKKHFWLAKRNVSGRKKETFKNIAFSFIIMFLAALSIVLNSGAFKDYMHEIRVENGIKNMILDLNNDSDFMNIKNQIEQFEEVEYATYNYDFQLDVGGPNLLDNKIIVNTGIQNASNNTYLRESITHGYYPTTPNEVLMSASGAIELLAELRIGGERLMDQFLTGEMDLDYIYSIIDDKEFIVRDGEFPRMRIVGLLDDTRVYEQGLVVYYIDGFEELIYFDDKDIEPSHIIVYKEELYKESNQSLKAKIDVLNGVTVNAYYQNMIHVDYNKIDSFLQFSRIGLFTIIAISSISYISLLFHSLNNRKYEIGLYRSIGYKSQSIMKILGIETIISGCVSAFVVILMLFGFATVLYLMPYNKYTYSETMMNLNILMIVMSIIVITFVATTIVIFVTNKRNLSKTIISNIVDY